MGAIVEGRRGVDRARATERALAAGIAGSDDALFGFAPLYVLTMAGEVDEAASAYPEAIELARRGGDRFAAAWMSLFRGRLKAEQGDLLAAEDDLAAPEVLSMSDTPTPLAYRAAFHAEVLIERGQIDEAKRLLSEVPLERVHVGHRVHFLGAKGRVELELGSAEQALASLNEAGAIAESVEIENPAFTPWRSQAALALQRLGREPEAQALARKSWTSRRGGGRPGRSASRCACSDSSRVAQPESNDSGTRLGCWRSRAPGLSMRGRWSTSGVPRRANSRREARERLRAGIELAHRCGARALVERANDELAATGAHRRTILYTGLEALTASERRVAQPGRWLQQQGDRPGAVRNGEDGRDAPESRLSQARDQLTRTARRRAHPARARDRRRDSLGSRLPNTPPLHGRHERAGAGVGVAPSRSGLSAFETAAMSIASRNEGRAAMTAASMEAAGSSRTGRVTGSRSPCSGTPVRTTSRSKCWTSAREADSSFSSTRRPRSRPSTTRMPTEPFSGSISSRSPQSLPQWRGRLLETRPVDEPASCHRLA